MSSDRESLQGLEVGVFRLKEERWVVRCICL